MNTAKDRRRASGPAEATRPPPELRDARRYIEEGDLFEDNALNGVL